ncbi:hypothetical protein SLEP1_g22525 [Rubroshorea leprosula]|uniref:Uncharacterized protein n=1 Tax=Rubroshorea leprosula TaxID=152421 RepID=A0AAV5J9F8_9ROSI|nr:hypothetical protein SLEP1_g22525 [Rubroshorea leprosula]
MPRRVGKEVAQQVEVAPVSPRHSEGENSPKHLPPISPLADRSYGNPIYRNDDEEKVDSTESSNKISQELQQIRKLQEEANQNIKHSLQSFLQAQRKHSDHFTQCLNVIDRAIHDNSRAIREEVAESRRTLTAVSERTIEHVRQQQNVPRQPFNRQQQNNPVGGILGPQDPVEVAFRAAEQLNANQQRYSTIEHIGRFTIQCGEASGDDFLKLRLFPSSLIGTALTWYLSLPQISMFTWRQMEDLFHIQFYRSEPEISMADLSRLTQRPGESSKNYLMRFRKARMKCHVALPEQEFVKLAQNGLDIELQKKFEGMEFRDFFELSYKVARYENLLREESQRKAMLQGTYYQDAFDLDVAVVFADKLVTCPNLVKVTQQVEAAAKHLSYESRRQYTFDVIKANEIFDYLKKSGHIKLPQGHRLPTVAEIASKDYYKIDKGLLRFPEKPKEVIGVGENPFPNIDVGVNVDDIRSISQRTYKGRTLAADDLRWVIEKEREHRAQQNQRLGGQHHVARIYASGSRMKEARHTDRSRIIGSISINLSCLVLTLPLVFQAKGSETTYVPTHVSNGSMFVEEEVIEVPAQEEEEEHDILLEQIIFNKLDESVACHIKPLYISTHMDGVPVNRVLVDNGAAVNVIPSFTLRNLGKNSEDLVYTDVTISDFIGGVNKSKGVLSVALTVGSKTSMSAFFVVDSSATYNALLGRDWIHSNWCVPSTLHQRLIFWNGGKTEVVYVDNRPFLANSNMVEAQYYDEDVGTICFFGMDRQGRPRGITIATSLPWLKANLSEVVHEGEEDTHTDGVTMEELDLAPVKLDDLRVDVQDPLKEVNLGTEAEPRITFVSGLLPPGMRDQIICLLHEFKDYFAWDYSKMPGLDRELVEHRLPINKGYKPYKQPPRRMSPKVILKVKEEVERLHKVGSIRTARYSEWLSNIVPVVKKNGKLRVCIAFWNLNLATPKDEYPMLVADLLVDGVARHRILSFMDEHSGYNQIFIAEEDISKTAFRCPGNIGTYEWVVMPFRLKNAGATYQRAMNAIFHDMISRFMEIYIDDVVVKSMEDEEHLEHLRKAFERMRQHGLKMNPLKCAFGVIAGNFLGFLVHERGLEVDKNKARVIVEARPPQNKKELQRFFGQPDADFKWERQHQAAFDAIKEYLSKPPVLVPPVKNKPLLLYIFAADESIGCLLAQENNNKQEQAVYYLSRALNPTEVKYSSVEKLYLALFFAAIKLRHYLLYSEVFVVSKTDVIKYMLSRPLLRGRIGKWILALTEFNLRYLPQKAVKGQALANFLADHPCLDINVDEDKGINLFSIDLVPWRLIFDGSSTDQAFGAGIIIVSSDGIKTQWCFQLDFECTNNQAEYEALVIGLELLVELNVPSVEIVGDSQLVLKQLSGEYKCTSMVLSPYFATAIQLLEEFDDVSLKHIHRNMNIEANELAQIASSVKMPEGILEKVIVIEKRILPSIHQRGVTVEACSLDVTPTDWRHPIIEHLRNPSSKTSRRTRMQALNYVLLGDVLYRRGQDELLLRCLGLDESCHVMLDVHNAPAFEFHPIVKPWPFRGWAIDLIGKIYPPSSKGHSFIIVAIDYFTKWVEARPMKKVEQGDVIKFIKEDLIHRFGLPETITSDQGTAFVGSQAEAFAKDMGFHLLNLTPHYAQANGQAEASNKIIINILEKMVDDNPKRWHELFSDTLWAYRTSQRSSAKVTPFSLTYGHDAVLPMELTARSLWIAIQNGLNSGEYNEAMIMELEDLEEARLTALDVMKAHKLKVAQAYNKRVKQKNLTEGSLVWKAVLPLGKKDPRYGKWSPNWGGPFQIHKVLKGGAYWLKSLNGELHLRKINGIYLKPYYPIVWEARDSSASTSA